MPGWIQKAVRSNDSADKIKKKEDKKDRLRLAKQHAEIVKKKFRKDNEVRTLYRCSAPEDYVLMLTVC